jgi:hypothetical protein
MKTFKEFAAGRGWSFDETAISNKIADVGNMVAKKNPKVLPGLTPVPVIKQALTQDANIEKLVQRDPTAAGAVGAYLGGPDAAKQLGAR